MRSSTELRALAAVAAVTMASGAAQAVAPNLTLDRLSSKPDALSSHMFATVGMFMFVSGGVLASALRSGPEAGRGPLLWCAVQKIGAAGAVAVGVRRRVLRPAALAVAAFDLASGIAVVDYRHRRDTPGPT